GRWPGPAATGGASAKVHVRYQTGGDGDQEHIAVVVAHPAVAVRRMAQAVAVVVVDHVHRAVVVMDIAAAGPARRADVARRRMVVVDHRAVVHYAHGGTVVAVVAPVVATVVPGLAVVAAVVPQFGPGVVAIPVAAPAAVGHGRGGHRRHGHGKHGRPGELQVHGVVSRSRPSPTGRPVPTIGRGG